MTKERIAYFDVLRTLACLMIIIMHSPMPNIGGNSYVLSSISMLTAPGIGLFFMVSGALLLPVRSSQTDFLKHRLSKILFPTLFWTLFYLAVRLFDGNILPEELPRKILSIPFSPQGHGVLWFMYTLTGLYLIAPIISPWLEKASKREIELMLGIWIITLLFPLMNTTLQINESTTGTFYYFTGYAGYFIMGYYLKNHTNYAPKLLLALFFILPLGLAVVCKIQKFNIDFYKWFWYLSIFTVMMSISWFLITKKYVNNINSSLITHFSKCSFGIYLVHIFVMRHILWRMDFISDYGSIAQIIMTVVLTVIISYALVTLISKLPYAEYIIGYKDRN